MATLRRSYVTGTVTLTTAGVVYNLAVLLQALRTDCQIPLAGSTAMVSADPGNAAGSTVHIGDETTSSTQFGYSLIPSANRNYQASHQTILFGDLHAVGSADGLKVNIEVMVP